MTPPPRHPLAQYAERPNARIWALKARQAGFGNLVPLDRVRDLARILAPYVVLPRGLEAAWTAHGQVPNLEGLVFWLPSVLKQLAVLALVNEPAEETLQRARLAPYPLAEWRQFRSWLIKVSEAE
jgi:hypothetical protein